MISKKNVLISSFLGTLLFFLMISVDNGNYCYSSNWCTQLFQLTDFLGFSIFIFPLILFFSIVTYKMYDEVFYNWIKFTKWYFPIFVLFALITSNSSNGGGFGGVVTGWFWAVILIFSLVVFFAVSLVLIISKRFSLRKQ